MSTDNDSKPPDRLPSPLTTAEQVTEPVGSKAWDTPLQGQDASPPPGQGMPDTPATPVEAELAERTGTLVEQAEYLANDTAIGDLLPLGTGPVITAGRIGYEFWKERDVIMADAKQAPDKGKAVIGHVRDNLLDKGRAVGRATAEAMGEMVHQVHDPP
jgi:hypothetical protein